MITLINYVAVFSIIIQMGFGSKNNACKTFSSYWKLDSSKDCYYIPDVYKDVHEIIKNHIGLFEKYEVTTEDGYILDLFRIPKKNPKGVILFQPPVTVDAKIWVNQYNESTAFLFWKAGYDVWLGNNRGTLYAKKHVNLTHNDPEFWDHSFHEMGFYDLKAIIDFIRKQTNGAKVIYIGHSMSTTIGLVYAITRPKEAAESVKVMIHMATVAFLKYSPSSFIRLSPKAVSNANCAPQALRKSLNCCHTVLNHYAWYLKLFRHIFYNIPYKKLLIYKIWDFFGKTPGQFDPQYFNLLVTQFGSEVSYTVLTHYAQMFKSGGNFQMFDHGPEKNLVLYGQDKPPLYPLEKIETPIYMIYSKQDTLATAKDIELLYSKLPQKAKIYGKMVLEGLNHVEFHFGKERIEKVYDKILKFLYDLEKTQL